VQEKVHNEEDCLGWRRWMKMAGVAAKPEKEFKVGAVRVAVWSNSRQTRDGKLFNSPKVVLERIYREESGSFKSTGSLDTNDIPKAILALKQAYEYLMVTDRKRSQGPGECQVPFNSLERIP